MKKHLFIAVVILSISALACSAVKFKSNVYKIGPQSNTSNISGILIPGTSLVVTQSTLVNGKYPDSQKFFTNSAHVTGNTVGYVIEITTQGSPNDTATIEYTWRVVHIDNAPRYDNYVISTSQQKISPITPGKFMTLYNNFVMDGGVWPPGTYRVESRINGQTYEVRTFEVY